MVNQMITLRLPPQLVEQSRSIAVTEGYKNLQEYVREALRRENAARLVAAAGGSRPGVKPLSRAARTELAEKLYS